MWPENTFHAPGFFQPDLNIGKIGKFRVVENPWVIFISERKSHGEAPYPEAEEHIGRQKEIIEELRRGGPSTLDAEDLPRTLEDTLRAHRSDLDHMAAERDAEKRDTQKLQFVKSITSISVWSPRAVTPRMTARLD